MPFGCHNIELLAFEPSFREEFLAFLCRLPTSVHISILFHCAVCESVVKRFRIAERLQRIYDEIAKYDGRVQLLLENNSVDVSQYDSDGYSYILRNAPDSVVRACLDICHMQTSKTLVPEYTYRHGPSVYSVHVSKCLNGDGFRDQRTHAKPHNSAADLMSDLYRLQALDVDMKSVRLVAEIRDADYVSMPLTAYECGLIKDCIALWNK